MKSRVFRLGALVVPWLAASPGAWALVVAMETGQFQGPQNGGEFVAVTSPSFTAGYASVATQTVIDNQGNPALGFSTFCLERSEHLTFKDSYDGVINQRAMQGGIDKHDPVGAGPAGDPISLATAYLYSQFAQGTLAGYAYGDGSDGYSVAEITARTATSAALQDAIWYFEDEISLKTAGSNSFIQLALDALTDPFAASNGAYGVSAINLSNGVRHRQDILVYQPRPLPDLGHTLALLGGALAVVLPLRRRTR